MSRFYLGIDGGQSSTSALIADGTGRILGYGKAGPCNHVSADEAAAKFKSVIGECLRQACERASISPVTTVFAAACLGFSGGIKDKEAYSRALIRSENFKITHDAEIALSGATAGEPGIIIIAGTGSIAFGKGLAGNMVRAGGWGYVFGDEGGGFDLTRRALRSALQFEEGWGPPTQLREALLSAMGLATATEVLHAFYANDYPRAKIASLATIVDAAAKAGDAVAARIIRESAEYLASLVRAVYHQLFRQNEHVSIAYIGGVFRSSLILASTAAQIQRELGCRLIPPQYNPTAGAVLEALRLDGNPSLPFGMPALEK